MTSKPRILFVATREPSYPRVAMTLDCLREQFEVVPIVSERSSYFARILEVYWKLFWYKRNQIDVVFIGFFAPIVAPLVRLVWSGPIVVDAFISFYDSLVLDKGISRRGSLTGRLAKWLDRFSLKISQIALVDTLEHRELFISFLGVKQTPDIRRLWASAEEKIFRPLNRLDFDSSEADVFEVLFWGGFIPLQGVETIIRAAAELRHDRVRFTIVGKGQTYQSCVDLAASLNLKNLVFEDWKRPDELRDLASRSHLLLGIFGSTEKAKRVIPNKAFQALALAKPLLTGRSKGACELLTENEDVLFCVMADPFDLANRVRWARTNYQIALEIGARGRETFLRKASSRDRSAVLSRAIYDAVKLYSKTEK